MRRFWDARAREDPYFFVDSRLRYRNPDTERFWSEGEADLRRLLAAGGVELAAADRVVEIGCGLGRLTRPIAAQVREVIAIDISEGMLGRARELNPGLANVSWALGDGRSLAPVADGEADVCISHVVFQHIPDPEITLGYVREMGRVLRPGGVAVFGISNDAGVHRVPRAAAPRRLREWLRSLIGRTPRGQAHPAWVGAPIELAELRSAAGQAELEVESITGEGTQYCIVRARRTSLPA
jgi:SAM-dependent methyltransferase